MTFFPIRVRDTAARRQIEGLLQIDDSPPALSWQTSMLLSRDKVKVRSPPTPPSLSSDTAFGVLEDTLAIELPAIVPAFLSPPLNAWTISDEHYLY